MATSAQKDEWIRSLRQDVVAKMIEARKTFLTLRDQYTAQDLGNAITAEEFLATTGGIDKADLPGLIALLDKQLEFGGAGELTVLFNLKP